MPERRYSRYKQVDVWGQLIQGHGALGVKILRNTAKTNSVSILHAEKQYRAVILARSSDWYVYSLNCVGSFQHDVTCIICGTHDSCVNVPVLALDTRHWYNPKKMRDDWGPLQPTMDEVGHVMKDRFEQHRRTQYGHNMLIGALMQHREDAFERLQTLKESTRLRIEAEIKCLKRRRVGRPIVV